MAELKKNVIILNKMFLGGWLNQEGKIGHEVIDILTTDEGKHYAYNLPHGACPVEIICDENEKNQKSKYLAKYLVLTTGTKTEKSGENKENDKHSFSILYVLELKEKLHDFSCPKSEGKLKEIRKKIKGIIDKKSITYGDEKLYDIYKDDSSLLLTFEVKKVYKAQHPIHITTKYNFKRNKGYLYSDTQETDYDNLFKKIENSIKNQDLTEYSMKISNNLNAGIQSKTFLDLVGVVDSELAYSNILHSVLSHKNMLAEFCNKFKVGNNFDDGTFTIYKEKSINISKDERGRMDICAESENQRIVIENKVHSGLNGIKTNNEKYTTTQLTTYYENWAYDKFAQENRYKKPLCFITVPTFRVSDIEKEIEVGMKDKWTIVTYEKIAEFIQDEKSNFKGYIYERFLDDIIAAFNNFSNAKNKEDFYASLFKQAIDESKQNT